MAQAVMARAGINGRIFDVYPNNAPYIQECSSEKGVLHYRMIVVIGHKVDTWCGGGLLMMMYVTARMKLNQHWKHF